MQQPTRDAAVAAVGALIATAAAAAFFVGRPPMPVRIGVRSIEEHVPAHYQVSVFPAWGAFVAVLARDLASGRSGTARLALLAVTGALAVARLAGVSPFSGHAVFLAALEALELSAPRSRRTALALPLALAGHAVTAFYKVRWNDAGGLALSSVVGALVGVAVHRVECVE